MDNVLIFEWYKEDNWYGKNYRSMLYKEDGVCFKTKTELNKFKNAFKEYINYRFNVGAKCKDLEIAKESDCITYKHVSAGPSYSCTNFKMTVADILNFN